MSSTIELRSDRGEIRDQIERAENVQVLVAIAILSGYLTLNTNETTLISSFETVVDILAFSALVFLFGKLLTLTVRPFKDHKVLREADRKVFPGIFLLTFSVTFAVIVYTIMPIPNFLANFSLQWDIPKIGAGKVQPADIYIILWSLLSAKAALTYKSWTSERMSVIETTAPTVTISFTSGSRGETFPLTLENPNSESVSPEDIRLEITPSSGVEVDIPEAKELGENTWRPRLAIPGNERLEMKINITRSDEADDVSEEEVKIETFFRGKLQRKHIVELEG